MIQWSRRQGRMGDDPPYLTVGTEVSAKYKGAFCEAKVRKVVRSVKCKVTFKLGLGTLSITDDQIRGTLRVGSVCEVRHPERKEFVEAIINKIQDCSQYTVVFDDGDITTLRRTALCLKSGRHFAESETLDQLPLTHPEHFGNPVIGGRKGRRSRQAQEESSDEEESPKKGKKKEEKEADIGKVVCVELGDKKKQKDNWFPGLVVAPTAQDTVRIKVKDEYLVRSFKDGRYFTVPKKEATEFTREIGSKVDNNTLKTAVEKALQYLDKDELPPHWDRDLLFGLDESSGNSDSDGALDSDSSDDEPREEKDHFVAQLYKFMDDRGTPINKGPTIGSRDVDLYKLFKVVHKLGGYNRVTNHNQWKIISQKLGFGQGNTSITNLVKQSYKKFLHSFEDFYRKLGCTMVNHPRGYRSRHRTGRSLIRDRDRATPTNIAKEKEKQEKEKNASEKPSSADNEKEASTEKKEDEKPNVPDEKEETVKVKEPARKTKGKEEKSDTPSKQKSKEVSNKESKESSESSQAEVEEKEGRSRGKKEIKSEPKQQIAVETHQETLQVKEEVPEIGQEEERKSRDVKSKPKDNKSKEKVKSSDKTKPKEEKVKVSEEEKHDDHKKKIEKKTPVEEEEKQTRSKSKEDIRVKKEPGPRESPRERSRESRTPVRDASRTPVRPRKEEETVGIKKRGRKRKDTEDKSRTEETLGHLASNVAVCTGDKLKVYYGPTHESKVTYEAKVLDIEEDGSESMYLVHYTGWNTRYDEWIKRGRIADNLSWTPSRAKRQRQQQSQHKASRTSQAKRGRPSISKESTTVTPQPRSTTPSSVTSSSSCTKSPAARQGSRSSRNLTDSASPGNEYRRRTRRMSGHTDISVLSDTESEEYDTDPEPENEAAQTRSKTEKKLSPSEKCTPSKDSGNDETKKVVKKRTPVKKKDSDVSTAVPTTLSVLTCTTSCSTTTATSISAIASLVSSSLVSSVLPSSQLLLSVTSAPVSVSPDTIAVASTTSTISATANSVSNVVPTITFADSSSSTDTSSDVSVSMPAFTISNVPISTAKSTTSTFTVASTKSITSAVNTTSTISTIVSATSTTSTVASTTGTNSTVASITSTTSDASITSTTSTVTAGISSNILVSITTPVSTVAVTAPITTAVTATITTSTTTASFATISTGTTTTTPATSSIIKTTCSITNITPVTSVFTSACFTATSNNSTLTVPSTITAVSSVSTTASTTCIPTPTSAIAICAPTVSTPTISTLAIVSPTTIGTCSINSVTATNTSITTTISTAVPVTITNSPTTTRNSVTVTPAISRSIISHVTNTTTSPTVSTIAISTSSTHLSDSTITPVTSVLPHMAITTTTTTTNTITTATDTTIASINTTTSTTISSASVTSSLPLTTIPSTSIVPVTTISTVFPSTITSIVSSVKSSSIPALTTVISTTPLTVLNICQPTFTTTCLHPSNMSAGIPVSKSTVTDNSSITISSNTTAITCTVNTASAGTIAVTAVTSAVSNTVSNIVDSNLNINNNINIINNNYNSTTVPSSTVSTTITAAATIASAMPATISTATTTTIISPVTSSITFTKSTAVVTSPVYTASNRSIISTASFSTATCMSITTNNSIAALATVADMVRFSATTHVLSSVSPVNTGLVTTVFSQASPITCSTFVTSTTGNVTSTSNISNASVCGTSASGSRSSIDTKSNSGNIKYSTLRDLSINVPSCKSQSSKYCKKLLSEKKSFEVKHELKSDSKSGAQSDDNQPKGRDFDLNQIRSELKGIEKAVKLPQDVTSATGNEDNEEDVTCKTENLETSDTEKSSPVKSEKEIDTDDVYEFKEPEPFEFEVRKRELSDERGSKLHRRPLTRFLDVECPKIEKSCRKRLIPPPKSEPVMSLDIEPRKKLRRTPIKRTENTSESKTVESSSDVKVPTILPVRYISSPKIPTPCEQAFEKLCETPFAVTLKPTSSNNSSPPILSLPDADPDHSSTELTTDLGPLSIFSEAHDDDGEDDNEDRLVISETDDMAEEIAEPLFSYQQRDHEDLFPSLVTSDVSVPTEESTTFHEHEEKSEEPPCLTPVVPGVFHAFDSSMQELPSKSNKVQSPGRDIDCESSSGPVQTSEKLASSKCNDDIKQLLKQEEDEYEDDSINAAIQRAIDQTMLNDDDSEIDIFSKESSNRNFKQEAVIETSNISTPKTSENTKILSRKKSIPSHEYTEESDTDSSDEDQRLVIDPMDEETSQHGDSSPLSGLQLRTASESSDLELKLHVNVDNKKDKDIPNPVDTTEVGLQGENSSSDLEFTGREKNTEVISVERKVIEEEDDDDDGDDDDDDDEDDEDDEDEDDDEENDEDDGEDEDDNTDTEVPRKYVDEDSHKEVDDSKYTEVLAPVIVNVNLENVPKVTEADLISENVVMLSTTSTAELPCISQNQEITGESIGNSVVPTISSSGKTIGSCNTSHTTILCESVSTSTASPILALAAVPLGEVEATDQQDTRVEDSDSQLLGSLLCQETIPGSPAQVQDTTTDESLSESKVLVLEMPFASVPASSCDSVSPAGSLSIPMSVPLTIPIVAVTATPAITTSTTAVTSIVTDTLPSEEQPTTDTLPSSTVTVTQAVPASSASPPCVLPLSSPGASKHNASEAAALMDNTPPTTPDSSLSTMSGSPRGDHGDMSPPMDNESSKSHRDSFEMDVDSSAEGAKVDHFSEDDSLLNVEDSGTCESRLQGLKLVSKKSVMELDKEIDSSPKKRRRSHKRSESESNKRLRCSTSRNVRSAAAGTGSDSDDTSENSALGCPPLSNTESTLSSKSSRPSKYNFFVELDPELDGSQRIALLQQKLQELRKTYMSVKAELACIDRRRKKLRRREREVEKATKQDVACS